MSFEILSEDRNARCGKLRTAHGIVETPAFMPVATKGGVKTLASEEVLALGTQAIIANAFLLYLKPGLEVISRAGSLHKFMNWNGSIFTDSGGFQMLRENFLAQMSKRGATFRSPFDGSRHLFTPEKCVEVQAALGSDVAMVLDDLPPYGSTEEATIASLQRTHDWARRSKEAHKSEKQLLFAIVQGGVFPELRRKSAEALASMDFDGYGVGGLSIGEPKAAMLQILEYTNSLLPKEKPRYLMGVGSPVEIFESIARGVDIFDSAFPTRNARHCSVYTRLGSYNITRGKYAGDFSPLEENCKCFACRSYSRAYIAHLLKVHELLGMRLITIHNLHFLQKLMQEAREAIAQGEFSKLKQELEKSYGRK